MYGIARCEFVCGVYVRVWARGLQGQTENERGEPGPLAQAGTRAGRIPGGGGPSIEYLSAARGISTFHTFGPDQPNMRQRVNVTILC